MSPVLPSSLMMPRNENDPIYQNKVFGNNHLRMGVILEIIDIEDKANLTKLAPEYNVMCVGQELGMGMSTSIYRNCLAMDSFGGVADYFQFKKRSVKDSSKTKTKGSLQNETGSLVLLLCLDGNTDRAIIIGSMPNPAKNTTLNKEKGHHLEGEFNGINYSIDKNGALTVTFKSATKDDGQPTNQQAGGSQFKLEKDGSIECHDGKTEKIRIDKTKSTIDLNAQNDISNTTGGNFNVKAVKNLSTISKDIQMTAGGSCNVKVAMQYNLQVGLFGSQTAIQWDINGQNYIKNSTMNFIIASPSISMGVAGQPAFVSCDLTNAGAPKMQMANLNNSQIDMANGNNNKMTMGNGSNSQLNIGAGAASDVKVGAGGGSNTEVGAGGITKIGPSPLPAVTPNTKVEIIDSHGNTLIGTLIGPFSSTVFISP